MEGSGMRHGEDPTQATDQTNTGAAPVAEPPAAGGLASAVLQRKIQRRALQRRAGAVGREGASYEQHAERVADAVVAGRSAEALLDQTAAPGATAGAGGPVQRQEAKEAPAPAADTSQDPDEPVIAAGEQAVDAGKA